MEKEIEELKNKIDELEKKYSFMKDYKIICTILDKHGASKLELNIADVENNNSIYICETNIEEGKIFITKDNRR